MSEMPRKLMPALYGGIISGVIIGVPFLNLLNCFCCAGVLLGGLLSVFYYTKDLTGGMPPLTSSDALQLGALSGVFGAVVGTVLSAFFLMLVGNVGGEMIYQILYAIYDAAGVLEQLPPGTLEELEGAVANQGQLPIFDVLFSLIIWMLLGPLFGLLGGLIGYAMFKPKPPMLDSQSPLSVKVE
jgi:hypothetical protein